MGFRRTCHTVLLLLAAWPASGLAQERGGPIAAGSASIAGRVVDARSGAPLANVAVRLFEPLSSRGADTKTGADGRYEFTGIAAGEFTVVASSDTHGRTCHGATDLFRVRCGPVAVVRDQRLAGVDFRLPESASISGMVVDHEGRAVAGATVTTMFGPLPGNRFVSGPDGKFQLTNVLPGENRVVVEPAAREGEAEPPVAYYPDGGHFLPFEPGERISGVRVALPRIATREITARVTSDVPGVSGIVTMIASAQPRMSRRLTLSAEGVATVRGLREGRYFIYARGAAPDTSVAAFQVVEVLDGGYEVALSLQPTGRVTGRIVAERGGLPPMDGVRVEASWVQDDAVVEPLARDDAEAGPDGYFRIDHLFGTRVIQLVGLSPEWRVVSIRHGRADVTSGVDVPAGTTVDLTIVVGRR